MSCTCFSSVETWRCMLCSSTEVTQKYQKWCLQTCKSNLYSCLRYGVLFPLPFNIEIYNMVSSLHLEKWVLCRVFLKYCLCNTNPVKLVWSLKTWKCKDQKEFSFLVYWAAIFHWGLITVYLFFFSFSLWSYCSKFPGGCWDQGNHKCVF